MIKFFEFFKFYKKGLNITYSAVVLDQDSIDLLLSTFVYPNPEISNWKIVCDHMTICMGELPEHLKRYWLGEEVTITARKIGISDKSVAVKVTGFFHLQKSDSEDDLARFPHVTLAINPIDAKPVDSNYITEWKDIKPLKLRGMVKEIQF
jgi:hypothetical protein